jgi:hypothetical protein
MFHPKAVNLRKGFDGYEVKCTKRSVHGSVRLASLAVKLTSCHQWYFLFVAQGRVFDRFHPKVVNLKRGIR